MERNEFRERMNQFKKAREANPLLSYWEWKNSIENTADKILKSNADFALRLRLLNRKSIPDWEYPNKIATHKLGIGTDNHGNNYIYPEILNINGYLHDFTDPKYKHNPWDGLISAEERGDTVRVNSILDGLNFTRSYKDLGIYPEFADGTDGIEIPKTALSDFIDEWNKARLKTGRFDDLLSRKEIRRLARNRNNTRVFDDAYQYMYNNIIEDQNLRKQIELRALDNNNSFEEERINFSNYYKDNMIGKTIYDEKTNTFNTTHGEYSPISKTIIIDPLSYLMDPTIFTHEGAHASLAKAQEKKIAEITGYNNDSPYLYRPGEIYSRLMQLREANRIDPNRIWTLENLLNFKEFAVDFNIFKLFDDEIVLRLFNEVASNQSTNPNFNDYNNFDLKNKLDNKIYNVANGGVIGYDNGTDGIKMTPKQKKKFLEDRQKYALMSGAISPALDIKTAADFTPIGNAIASKDIYDATVSGNYLDAGLIGASLVVPPALAKPIKRYIPTVSRTVADKINKLLDNSNAVKETEWNNTVNRAIERIYDKDVRDRAALLKDKYGVDILSLYDAIDDLYTNNYESIPKARIMHMDDGARAKMHTNPTASKAWATEGKLAGMKDFEMQVRPDVEPSKEVAEHEINHWWTYSMMQNPDWRRSELLKITKDFEGALHKTNPLDPDNSDYYRDWMELNAYGINVVNSMKELGIPFTKENVIKFINLKPDTSALKRAARQFKNMDLYFDWLRTMPLAGMAGAAYMLENKEDNSYADGSDGIYDSLTDQLKLRLLYDYNNGIVRYYDHIKGHSKNWIDRELTNSYGKMSLYAGELPEIVINPKLLYATLYTYYPIISEYPFTGHSELITPNDDIITAGSRDDDYNLLTKNCSDATKCALNNALNLNINPIGFTTPGDVKDAVSKIKGVKSTYKNGVYTQKIPISNEQARKLEYEAYKRRREGDKTLKKLPKLSIDEYFNNLYF